jgi:gentisate 1,2-dioxygenase
MGGILSLLPKGFAGEAARQTDGQIVVCLEGRGRTEIGGQWFDWGPKDVFIVPNWTRFRHEASAESVLFTLSDRPAQEKLNIWREARG